MTHTKANGSIAIPINIAMLKGQLELYVHVYVLHLFMNVD